ncbi:MAG: aminotransferase class V-fold PLP-dependent enzyme [Rubrimonas sp.]
MIACQRSLFDIPADVAYLNCAYMGPLPLAALQAGEDGLRRKARPWGIRPADFFEEADQARALFAALVGADAEGVALIPSASYGLTTAARALDLKPGDRVLVLKDQFPSNVYPWAAAGAELVAVDVSETDATEAVIAALDGGVRLAALPNVLWTTGARLDLVRIGAACRAVGAALALDLTQSAGAMVTDLAAIGPDFAVAAGYKWLLCPYATGFLWVAPQHRDARPLEETWTGRRGSEDFSGLVAYRDEYQPGARRFDMGERANFALLPAAIASLRLLLDWTPAAVEATLAARNAAIADRAAAMGATPTPADRRGPHYLSLALPAGARPDIPARLAERGVHVSQRGASLRITPHLWNDDADVDRLFDALGPLL